MRGDPGSRRARLRARGRGVRDPDSSIIGEAVWIAAAALARHGTCRSLLSMHGAEKALLVACGLSIVGHVRALISNNGYAPTTLADYGNYCGKGGSGEPIDSIGACCQAHDNCYEAQDCSIFNNACTAPCSGCDNQAMECWVGARHADPER